MEKPAPVLKAFREDLKRRRVARVATDYQDIGWGLLETADFAIENLQAYEHYVDGFMYFLRGLADALTPHRAIAFAPAAIRGKRSM